MLNKIIETILQKQGKVAVPETFQKDYVRLSGYKLQQEGALETLVREYNKLLKDYFSGMSTHKLAAYLKSHEIPGVKQNMKKQILVEIAYKAFRMEYTKE
jgi:hypothetical protein